MRGSSSSSPCVAMMLNVFARCQIAVPGVSGEEESHVQALGESQMSPDIPSHGTPVVAWDAAATNNNETKVPLAMQHLLYAAYADAHMRTRLADELVPLQRIFGMLLIGPRGRPPTSTVTVPESSDSFGREDNGTGEQNSSGSRKGSWWKLLGIQGWVSIIACLVMCVNMARALGQLGHIGSASFPWVDSMVTLLWLSMCSLTAIAFLFGGGLERLVCDLLKVIFTSHWPRITFVHTCFPSLPYLCICTISIQQMMKFEQL